MLWTLIILVVLVAALLLIGGLYAARGRESYPTSQLPPEDSAGTEQAHADGE